jgi:uncharacterized protein YeeX (DUF496 family)
MNNNDKTTRSELRTNVNWTNHYNSNFSKYILWKQRRKNKITRTKEIKLQKWKGLKQRSGLFGNWIDYITKISQSEEEKHELTLIFTKFALNYQYQYI